MIVYREAEVIDIIKIIALGYGNRIDNKAAKVIIDGYRAVVDKKHTYYRWLLNEGGQVDMPPEETL